MSLAPSYSLPIPFRPRDVEVRQAPAALSRETTEVDVTELVAFATRLDAHAVRDGARVSAMSLIAKAYLVASLRHPGIDARWPLLPARHGVRLSELTAALEGPDAASPIPDDAAILSVGAIVGRGETDAVELSLVFDPRRADARGAHRFIDDLAGLLEDPWELIAQGS